MSEEHPNVAIIVMDTARWTPFSGDNSSLSLSFLRDRPTSVSFSNAFSTSPWTLPSHASLFTGTMPSKHGAHAGHKQLEESELMIQEILRDVGYETVAVSNNTWISEEFGFADGFDTFYKTWQYVQSSTDLGSIAQLETGFDLVRAAVKETLSGNPITNFANAIYGQFVRRHADDGARRTNEWINSWARTRDDSRPYFLFVNYLEPHLEYRPPEKHALEHLPEDVSFDEAMAVSQDAWGYIAGNVELSADQMEILRCLYRAEISYLLEQVEELVETLEAHGGDRETLLILTSDHGENIGEHGLMDHQYALYDTLLHVPLFVDGGPFESGIYDDLVQLIDVPPTILDVLDIDAPAARKQFQGLSFHPDAGTSREYAFAEYMAPQPALEVLEEKVGTLPESVREYDRSLHAIRSDQYKLIRGSDGTRELYDVKSDPGEIDDLRDKEQTVVKEMEAELDIFLSSFNQSERSGDVSMSDDSKARLEDLGYLQ